MPQVFDEADVASEHKLPVPRSTPASLLRIVGMPETNLDDMLTFPVLENGESPADKCIDIIDASSDEQFTSTTCEALISAHRAHGKDLLLARVVTIDESDNFYCNYYAAHRFNKHIFRTDPGNATIYRVDALNPMNNMPIFGDVHYYRVFAKGTKETDVGQIPVVYSACYFGTDDDYLMHGSLRQYFKKNAINADDIFLYTRSTSDESSVSEERLVSDPTDPSAVATTIGNAMKPYLTSHGQAYALQELPSTVDVVIKQAQITQSAGGRLWKRLRTSNLSSKLLRRSDTADSTSDSGEKSPVTPTGRLHSPLLQQVRKLMPRSLTDLTSRGATKDFGSTSMPLVTSFPMSESIEWDPVAFISTYRPVKS